MTISSSRLRLGLALAILLCAALLRFSDLGLRAYGNDEATTSLRVAGATLADYGRLFDGVPRRADALQATYQGHVPGSNVGDVVGSLASEDPQHPPLFYVIDRFALFGSASPFAHRLPAAVFSVLLIPAGAWFAFELFGTALAAWIAAMVLTVSPFQIAYAQQAREYSLWMLLTAISSALLLRLVRRPCPVLGVGYAVAMIAGLYADLLFLTVAVAHAITLVLEFRAAPAERRSRFTALLLGGGAILIALIAFVPWLRIVAAAPKTITNNGFLAEPLSAKVFAGKWLFNAVTLVFDGEYGSRYLAPLALLALLVLVAAVISFRRARRGAALLIWPLALVPTLALLGPDLLHHESRSTASRYLVPLWLALEMMLVFLLATVVGRYPRRGRALLATTLLLGLISAFAGASARTWWVDGSTAGLIAQSRALDALKQPVDVLFVEPHDRWDFSVMELVNRVAGDNRFIMVRSARQFIARPTHADVVLDPEPFTVSALHAAGRRGERLDIGPTRSAAFVTNLRASAVTDEDGISLWRL